MPPMTTTSLLHPSFPDILELPLENDTTPSSRRSSGVSFEAHHDLIFKELDSIISKEEAAALEREQREEKGSVGEEEIANANSTVALSGVLPTAPAPPPPRTTTSSSQRQQQQRSCSIISRSSEISLDSILEDDSVAAVTKFQARAIDRAVRNGNSRMFRSRSDVAFANTVSGKVVRSASSGATLRRSSSSSRRGSMPNMMHSSSSSSSSLSGTRNADFEHLSSTSGGSSDVGGSSSSFGLLLRRSNSTSGNAAGSSSIRTRSSALLGVAPTTATATVVPARPSPSSAASSTAATTNGGAPGDGNPFMDQLLTGSNFVELMGGGGSSTGPGGNFSPPTTTSTQRAPAPILRGDTSSSSISRRDNAVGRRVPCSSSEVESLL